MGLPDDVQPLFDRLGEFLLSDRSEGFRADAARRCASVAELMFGEKGFESTAPQFLDYLTFSYRDADGRSGVELFLKEESASLEPEERAAIAGFLEARFGLFEVEEILPEGLRVRCIGKDDRFKVQTFLGPGQTAAGNGIIGRLVPYRDHHLLTGYFLTCSARTVSEVESLFRSAGPAALAAFADPVQFLESMRAAFLGNTAPRNLREASSLKTSRS